MRVPRRYSMTHREEFSLVRTKGRSKAGRYLVMATLPEEKLAHLKLAYITSKRVGKAVVRNQIRRRLRAVVSAHGEKITGPRYLVLIARNRAGEATYQELEKEWLSLARKLDVLKASS